MKRLFFIAVAATGLFAGCAKNEITPGQIDQKITFQPVTGKAATKAVYVNTTTYDKNMSFASAAFMTSGEDGKSWKDLYSTAGEYISKQKISHSDATNSWSTATQYYWPVSGGKLTFFSVSPWDNFAAAEAVTIDKTNGVKISSWNVENHQDIDVMVADIAADQTANTSTANNKWTAGVPTIFRHKLAQIVKFNVKTAGNYIKDDNANTVGDIHVYINSITIQNYHTTGSYVSTNFVNGSLQNPVLGTWTETNEVTNCTLVTKGTGLSGEEVNQTGEDLGVSITRGSGETAATYPYLLVLPQDFEEENSPQIVVSYTVKQFYGKGEDEYTQKSYTGSASLYDVHLGTGTAEAPTKALEWEMNKRYTYQLVIDIYKDNVIYWAPEVVDWADEPIGAVTLQ